jgi:hypothetical protein
MNPQLNKKWAFPCILLKKDWRRSSMLIVLCLQKFEVSDFGTETGNVV